MELQKTILWYDFDYEVKDGIPLLDQSVIYWKTRHASLTYFFHLPPTLFIDIDYVYIIYAPVLIFLSWHRQEFCISEILLYQSQVIGTPITLVGVTTRVVSPQGNWLEEREGRGWLEGWVWGIAERGETLPKIILHPRDKFHFCWKVIIPCKAFNLEF